MQLFFRPAVALLKIYALMALALLFSRSLQAQCFVNNQAQERFYNIMVAIDQSFITLHSDNVEFARMSALGIANNTIAALNASSLNNFRQLNFKIIFFPTTKAPSPVGAVEGHEENWADDVNTFYKNTYPCVPFDCIILFTDEIGSGSEFGWPTNHVALFNGGNQVGKNAHEIGHTLGLVHLGEDCCTGNNIPMMCPGGGNLIELAANCPSQGNVNALVFNPTNCSNWADEQPLFPLDHVCPPVTSNNMQFIITTDNPNPVLGCQNGKDITEFTVTLVNDNSTTARTIRASIADMFSQELIFLPDPSLDFDCITTIPNSRTEFRITGGSDDPNTPPCEGEQAFLLGPGESKTVKFKVKYLGGTDLPNVMVYTGLVFAGAFSKTTHLIPFSPVPGGSFTTLQVSGDWPATNQPLLVSGNLMMNNPSEYDFSTNKKILFMPGASMEILSNSIVKMPNVAIEGCDQMWKGIKVKQGGTLDMSAGASLKDAQYGVNLQKGSNFSASNTSFVNNNYAIRTDASGTGNYNITLLGNRYETDGTGLKPHYNNQFPAPLNIGFTGLYLKDAITGVTLGTELGTGANNFFSHLQHGILSFDSDLAVRNSEFSNIDLMAKGPLYEGPAWTGYGVYAEGGALDVQNVAFTSCNNGIAANGSDAIIKGCLMNKVQTGVFLVGTLDNQANVSHNTIDASTYGISALWTGNTQSLAIDQNTVTIDQNGNSNGFGILVSGAIGVTQGVQCSLGYNEVNMKNGNTGIFAGVAQQSAVTGNRVSLQNLQSNQNGIYIEGGASLNVNCNSIGATSGGTDALQTNGLYAVHPSQTHFTCNSTTGMYNGLHFEGTLSKTAVSGNFMSGNDQGLLLGVDCIIGTQVHKGNQWDINSGARVARHLSPGIAASSLFTVDGSENAAFLPSVIDPPALFSNQSDPRPSFSCSPGGVFSCLPPPESGGLEGDKRTARGEVPGTLYTTATNWLAQRRLYESISTEGNPAPDDLDITTFLEQAQKDGLAGYADMQSQLRQQFGLSPTDRDALSFHTARVFEQLNLLGEAEQAVQLARTPENLAEATAQCNRIRRDIEESTVAKSSIRAAAQAAHSSTASDLLMVNNTLTGDNDFQVNERQVNGILLNFIASGFQSFNDEEMTELSAIANQCPLSGGEAVLRARSLLRFIDQTPVYYDDDLLCAAAQERQNASQSTINQVTLFPNPVSSNILTVEFAFTDDCLEHRLLMFDPIGRVVQDIYLNGQKNQQVIDIGLLPTGVYGYSIGLPGGMVQGKIVVMH